MPHYSCFHYSNMSDITAEVIAKARRELRLYLVDLEALITRHGAEAILILDGNRDLLEQIGRCPCPPCRENDIIDLQKVVEWNGSLHRSDRCCRQIDGWGKLFALYRDNCVSCTLTQECTEKGRDHTCCHDEAVLSQFMRCPKMYSKILQSVNWKIDVEQSDIFKVSLSILLMCWVRHYFVLDIHRETKQEK